MSVSTTEMLQILADELGAGFKSADERTKRRAIESGITMVANLYQWDHSIVEEQFVSTADKVAGTVAIEAGEPGVTGTSTAFAATDVGKFIQFNDSDETYVIASYSSPTAIQLTIAYSNPDNTPQTAATYRIFTTDYALASQVRDVFEVSDNSQNRMLMQMDRSEMRTLWQRCPQYGNPTHYALLSDGAGDFSLRLWPGPDEAYPFTALYRRDPAAVPASGAGNDGNALDWPDSASMDQLLISACRLEGAAALAPSKLSIANARFNAKLDQAKRLQAERSPPLRVGSGSAHGGAIGRYRKIKFNGQRSL